MKRLTTLFKALEARLYKPRAPRVDGKRIAQAVTKHQQPRPRPGDIVRFKPEPLNYGQVLLVTGPPGADSACCDGEGNCAAADAARRKTGSTD